MISSKKMKFAITTAAATAVVCTGALAANVTCTSNVNVRSGPGNSYSVLTVMSKGQTSANLGQSGSWVKVSVNGKTGYVYSKYLSSSSSSSTSTNTNTSATTMTSTSKTVYVTASSLNVRSGAGTSYSVIGSLANGKSASVVGTSNGWYKIKYGSGYGYISSSYTSSSAPSSSAAASGSTSSYQPVNVSSSKAKTMYSTTAGLNVRSGQGTSYASIGSLSYGQSVSVVDSSSYWYKIKFGNGYGYVGSKYLSSSKPTASAGTSSGSSSSSSSSSSASSSSITSIARSLLGCSYSYGASGPSSFDCSGFTQYVYGRCGISIPRTSSAQYASAKHISRSELRAGDLVFFSNGSSSGSIGHVAIYLGDGMIIHAANASTGVCTTSLNSTYYSSHYVGAGRY